MVQWIRICLYLPASPGDRGSVPGLGRFHMPQGNKACTPQLLKPACLQPVLHNKRSQRSLQPEKVCAEQSRLSTQPKINKKRYGGGCYI